MSGIGLGLAVFGAGSAIAGLSTAITNFTKAYWVTDFKNNVKSLLDMQEFLGGDIL